MSATARRLVSVRHHAVTLAPTPGLPGGTQLGLFIDVAPAPALARASAPRLHLAPAPRPVEVLPGQIALFEPPPVLPSGQALLFTLPPRVQVARPRLRVAPPLVEAEQLPLPLPRRVALPLHPDLLTATAGLCLAQQDECGEDDCRHHLGAVREFHGARFGCAVAVALAYPNGLAPVHVAALTGATESLTQAVERGAHGKVRVALQRLRNEESEDGRRARRRAERVRAMRAR